MPRQLLTVGSHTLRHLITTTTELGLDLLPDVEQFTHDLRTTIARFDRDIAPLALGRKKFNLVIMASGLQPLIDLGDRMAVMLDAATSAMPGDVAPNERSPIVPIGKAGVRRRG